MVQVNAVNGLKLNSNEKTETTCSGCLKGKMHRSPFPTGRTRATAIGEIIHSDICGPMNEPSLLGSRYFIIFKDDFSSWTTVYFLKQKSEAIDYFKKFVARLKVEKNITVNILRTDRGGEFIGKEFVEWMTREGIIHQTTAPYTPQQNGVSERYNRTVMESARSMLYARGLPLKLWAEAVNHANYLQNRILHTNQSATPFEQWTGTKPNLSDLRIFGSKVYVHVPDERRKKLDPKCIEGIFIGFCTNSKAIRVWEPSSGKILISRDVKFDESSVSENPRSDYLNFFPKNIGDSNVRNFWKI